MGAVPDLLKVEAWGPVVGGHVGGEVEGLGEDEVAVEVIEAHHAVLHEGCFVYQIVLRCRCTCHGKHKKNR